MEVSYRVQKISWKFLALHEGGPYHIETSPLICYGYQWTGFYGIGTFVMKELKNCFLDTSDGENVVQLAQSVNSIIANLLNSFNSSIKSKSKF